MANPDPNGQGEIEHLLDTLFDKVLEFFAGTGWFLDESSPSIFLVYAHESSSTSSPKANAAWAIKLIDWLTKIRSKTFSDKSLVPGPWVIREDGYDSVHNILSNQFCLLPARSRVAKGKRVFSVDKIIVCCSELLESYSKDTRMDAYTNAIKNFYLNAEKEHQDANFVQAGINKLTSKFRHENGFHHVLTELAFLDIRSLGDRSNHDIIPVRFDDSDIAYLRHLSKTQTVHLKMQNNGLSILLCQSLHKLFFKLLRRIFEGKEQSIKIIESFYDNCVQNLSQEALPLREDFMIMMQQGEKALRDNLDRLENDTQRVVSRKLPEKVGLWLVPFENNQNFVGRESYIQDMDEKLRSNEHCQRIALWGLGGIGKTQVVLEYAHRRRKDAPSFAVFWITAISAITFGESYLAIGKVLDIPGILEPKADVKKLVQETLSDERTGEWLIIIDNADDDILFEETSHGTKRLINFLPSSPRGSIIFTTRTREAALKQVQAQENMIELTELSKPEAEDLLQRILGKKLVLQEQEAVDTLLILLARLPLAIIQATSFITTVGIGISEYITLFQSSELETIEILSQDFEDRNRYHGGFRNPIATTWLVSFEDIQKKDTLAIEYLKDIACLLRENIPQSLLPNSGSLINDKKAIGILTAYSFLKEQEKKGMFDMHRLVHLVTKNWLKDQGQLASQTNITLVRISAVLPYGGHEDYEIWKDYLSHATYIADSSIEYVGWEVRSKLLDKIGRCQTSLGRYEASEKTHRQLLALRKTALGDKHPSTLISMNNLASILNNQGNYVEAEQMHRETLALRKTVSGDKHPETLTSMNNLALTLSNQGNYVEAEKIYRETLALRKTVLGDKHPETLTSMSNLASVLSNQGNYVEAEKMHRETLALWKTVSGDKHPETLTSMSNLAYILSNQGNYVEAEKIYRETLALRKTVSGDKHPETLTSMNNLASVLSNQGNYVEAEKMNRETLALRKTVLGDKHPSTLVSMNQLALVLSNQGNNVEAEKMNRETLALRKTVLGDKHPSTLVSMNQLALTLSNQGNYVEAEKMYRETLALRKTVQGDKHPRTLLSMDNLAFILDKQGKFVQAEIIKQEIRALKINVSAEG